MKSLERWGHVLSELSNDPFTHLTPAFICCSSFIVGFYIHNIPSIVILLGTLLLLSMFFLTHHKKTRSLSYYSLLIIALWMFSGCFFAKINSPDKKIVKLARFWEKPGLIWEGKILPFADLYPHKIRYIVRITRVFYANKAYKINEKIILTVKHSTSLWLPGDFFLSDGKIKKPRNFNNPGRFDYVLFLARKGIFGQVYLKNDLHMAKILRRKNSFNPFITISRIAEKQRRKLSECIGMATNINKDPPAANGLLQAMLLGYKHFLEADFGKRLSVAGVRHIVAVSGLHFGCVAGIVFFIVMFVLKRFCPSMFLFIPARTLSFFLALPLLVFYALLTGLAPPAMRAFILIVVAYLIFAHYRQIDQLTTVTLAAFLIIIMVPYQAFSPSFILSFAAISAILFIALPLMKTRIYPTNFKHLLKESVIGSLWISFVVQIFLFPFTMYFFHRFPLTGFVSNPLIVPLVTLIILPFGIIFLLLACISTSLAISFYYFFYAKPVDILIAFIKFFSNFSHFILWSGKVSKGFVFLYILAILVSVGYLKKQKTYKKIIFLTLFPLSFYFIPRLTAAFADNTHQGYLQATIIDVSQGSSTLVKLPNNHTFLIDGGGFRYSSFDTGRNVILPFLASQNITSINTVVLSHYHPDHARGLLFFARYYPVSEFWETGCKNRSFDFPDLSKIFKKRRITTYKISEIYGSHKFGNVKVDVLSPPAEKIPQMCKNLNSTSMVIKFSYGDTILIVPGDVDSRTLSSIDFRIKDGKQTVLIAPHHGSKYSFNKRVFEKINPCIVIVSCGYKNPHGSPHNILLNWCMKNKIRLLRTDLNGAIFLRTDGKKWMVKTYGVNHHWRKTKCGTIFSETSTGIEKHWRRACSTQKM